MNFCWLLGHKWNGCRCSRNNCFADRHQWVVIEQQFSSGITYCLYWEKLKCKTCKVTTEQGDETDEPKIQIEFDEGFWT